ncbi:MAG: cation-transporting P-type ATPase [Alphaproteobacteria bacterium]|nr:cation-transporting P-type ATPase [Alphaproteobacteria bacterium]MCL2505783.1 cation-transporting P-type ATPase [Alphaproteobacteria bacterium]
MKTEKYWYAVEQDKVVKLLESDSATGLTGKEAAERLTAFGHNELSKNKKASNIIRFLKHFHDILIYILFAAAVVTLFLQEYVDTVIILLVTIINAAIGFIQENKAEKALEDIKKMLSRKAMVVRDNTKAEIDAFELVAGDIVLLNPGDRVPADIRILRSDHLQTEESALTGESLPVEKKTDALPENTMLGDRINMVFSGTTVSTGTGMGIVTATGAHTELGKINQMIADAPPITTPLIKQTQQFGKNISFIIVFGSLAIFLFGYAFRNYDISELLMSVIGLAIIAIPEGLPAILSIILAIGVQNMAKRKAIVRNLPSVETLGSVSVICSDKTGTLTKNEMTVQTLETRDGEFEVSGMGYAPEGQIFLGDTPVDFAKENVLKELIECFNVCNDAALAQDADGLWNIMGDPTEGALITLFQKADIDHTPLERISTIPFDSDYKYMATLIEKDNHNIIYIKGAPDKLLDIVKTDSSLWNKKISTLALRGQRIIGAAYKIVDKNVKTITHDDIKDGIVFLGLAGIIDPPREEAIEAIRKCKEAGITVKMITGDHIDTARTIAKELGIGDGTKAIEGKELEGISDEEMEEAAFKYDVFARTSPEHKLRLVKALQSRNVICAMTGDGVNDAPALKKADVGVAMGIKGTEVTKDSAEIVLTDDNFSTIVAAVEEGRRVYDNLKKTILFILPTNGAGSFLIIASILFGILMPLTPVQILWVNMVTSVTVSFALAFEKIEPDAMKRPPRPYNSELLSGYFIWRILFVSVLIGGWTLIVNIDLFERGYDEDLVRTITIQTLVIAQMFHLFNSRSIRGFAFNADFFKNKAVFVVCILLLIMQASITYIPFMNEAFGTVPLDLSSWKYPFILGTAVFIIVEIEKAVMRKIDFVKGIK